MFALLVMFEMCFSQARLLLMLLPYLAGFLGVSMEVI